MGIGVSIFLIAVGAVLKFATSFYYYGINFDVVGVIMMVAGALGLISAFIVSSTSRSREHANY